MAVKLAKGIPSGLAGPFPMSALEKLNLKCIESDAIAYNDSSPVSVFTIPANTLIVALVAVVDTAFDVASSISMGDGSTAAKYGVWKGSLRSTGPFGKWVFEEESSRVTMQATISAAGAAQGSVRFFLIYRPNSNEQGYIR